MAVGAADRVARIVDVDGSCTDDSVRWWAASWRSWCSTLVVGAMAYVAAPQPFSLAFVVLVLVVLAAFLRPSIGVYLIVVS